VKGVKLGREGFGYVGVDFKNEREELFADGVEGKDLTRISILKNVTQAAWPTLASLYMVAIC
jgi:hypothetical protein